jgi:DNA-binding transcriptional MerR regulator
MSSSTCTSVILWRWEHSFLTLEDLARAADLHPTLVESFVSYGLLEPAAESGGAPLFAPAAVGRLRRIVRLRRDLGVNLAGIAVILEMRDRLERLQKEVAMLRERIRAERT